ncbi:MAG: thiamine phosphate synthase [Gemmatimonadota bacterium]
MIEQDDVRLRLCVVTDDLRDGVSGLVARAVAAERGGATMLLLRLKHADVRVLVEAGGALREALRVPVLVSERLDVALACGAAGVHLTSSSMPVIAVRSQTPPGFLVGASVSTEDDVPSALDADYVTIGPVAGAGAASLGVARFAQLAAACARPVIAIGGVDAALVGALRAAGASGVAAIRTVLAADDPAAAAAVLVQGWQAPAT